MGPMRPRAQRRMGGWKGAPLGKRPSGGDQDPEEKAPASSFLGRVWGWGPRSHVGGRAGPAYQQI